LGYDIAGLAPLLLIIGILRRGQGVGSEGQAGGRNGTLNELTEIIRTAPKCPPNVNCAGLTATLGVTAGLYLALEVISEGLGSVGTQGCNGTVMRLIEKDLKRISELLSKARGLISEGSAGSEVIDLITNEAYQVITDVARYYPVIIDLLARCGRGQGV